VKECQSRSRPLLRVVQSDVWQFELGHAPILA
jgi:hypothetical protein